MSSAGRNPFDPRVVASLVGAGILAFAAFMVLGAYAPGLRTGHDGRGHALSVSAIGFQGIVRLVEFAGGRARLIRDPALLETEDLLVVALEPGTDDAALNALVERRQGKATLLVLPKWAVLPDAKNSAWVRSLGLHDPREPGRLVHWLEHGKVYQGRRPASAAAGRGLLADLEIPLPMLVQAISGDELEPLLATPGGRTILGRYRQGPLYILADPDLIDNQGLRNPDSARAALALLDSLNATGAKSVAFDLTLNGFGTARNALKLAFEPPFVVLTLALFVAALLAGLHGAFRFGPPAQEGRAIAFGKAALVENSAGLFRIARREHRTGGAYAELIREEAAFASGAHGLRGPELDAYLDRFSSPDRPPFSSLAADAACSEDRHDLVSAARALFQWKKDLIK